MQTNLALDSAISAFIRLTPRARMALHKLGLVTSLDLLYYFPSRYEGAKKINVIENLADGDEAIVYGTLRKIDFKKTWKSGMNIATATLDDNTGTLSLVWFNQPYIARMYSEGSMCKVSGKIVAKDGKLQISNPIIEKIKKAPEFSDSSLFGGGTSAPQMPVYSETAGLSSNWIYHVVRKVLALDCFVAITDPLPSTILKKYSLPSLRSSLLWIHAPRSEKDIEAARRRFAFEEIFFIQLERQKDRLRLLEERALVLKKTKSEIAEFITGFGFKLTGAQDRAIETIITDFKKSHPMSRLLEGDVGSGKSAVAAVACYLASPYQSAYMAPTEILANQMFESFVELFSEHKKRIGLIAGSGARIFPSKSNGEKWTKIPKSQLLRWVSEGTIDILIGTHAIIQKSVAFKNLALVVVDEQHRFGVSQRKALLRQDKRHEGVGARDRVALPHLLSMSATPIPRTLALTIFGDLDLSVLDELPAGRKQVNTKIVLEREREEIYAQIRVLIADGRQAYVICPRVYAPDRDNENALEAKSVEEEKKRLEENVFRGLNIAAITGKNTPAEKARIMKEFGDGKHHILVSTSVVEVGINVPNATVMIIENAERFGLASLHQLRGRIKRSSHEPHCFVFTESRSSKTIQRLRSFVNSKNGFELAEKDLEMRGAGDLLGVKQWGVSDIAMEALKNIRLVEAARTEAVALLEQDIELTEYPLLRESLARKKKVHME